MDGLLETFVWELKMTVVLNLNQIQLLITSVHIPGLTTIQSGSKFWVHVFYEIVMTDINGYKQL